MRTSCSGRWYGSGCSSTASTALYTAVVPPIPTASVRMATIANPGFRVRVRTANATSRLTSWSERVPRASRASSLIRSTPPNATALRLHVGVERELLGQLALIAGPEHDRAESLDEIGEDAHRSPPAVAQLAFMTQFTAAEARSHA